MSTTSPEGISRKQLWTGRIFAGFVALALLGSAIAKLAGAPAMVDGLTRAGIPRGAIVPIAALELSCLAVYLVPRTRLLGMLLVTGYFGGAVVTHIIGRENFFPPLIIGFLAWLGAYLQMPALRQLLPAAKVGESLDGTATQATPTMASSR